MSIVRILTQPVCAYVVTADTSSTATVEPVDFDDHAAKPKKKPKKKKKRGK